MKALFDFLVKLIILSGILWGVVYWGASNYPIDIGSVFVAWLMVVLNSLTGYLLFEYGFDKESKVFTLVVFGGVALRLLIVMVLVLVINLLGMVKSIDFVVSFISFYCIYLVLEILAYQKKNQLKKKPAKN
ncbi:hypothetical protein BIU88_12485 [Chlorobaculum limnaeum]|uniref:ATP synthase subunit I n=2 Tax=Chlorobaculum limnaeum TaxID=274537 RepID=A0A1D8D139_CHLLM|nr:hypothetical protein [Chlorobaculum limnaeum]AOS84872.1 hypothetical protein BIU88_12485 [Chlorobaculum limnaeum]